MLCPRKQISLLYRWLKGMVSDEKLARWTVVANVWKILPAELNARNNFEAWIQLQNTTRQIKKRKKNNSFASC